MKKTGINYITGFDRNLVFPLIGPVLTSYTVTSQVINLKKRTLHHSFIMNSYCNYQMEIFHFPPQNFKVVFKKYLCSNMMY